MKVTVIGATGAVGLPTAFHLAAQRLADELIMIGGKRQNILKHHAMDISTAVSALDIVVRAGNYEDMQGSDIVINAAGVHVNGPAQRAEMMKENIPLVLEIANKIKQLCPEAILITATNPVGPLNYAAYLTGHFQRNKLIGYSLNDSLRLREMAARALGVKVSQVDGTVIGEHGPRQVPLFSSIRIDGKPIGLSEEMKQQIRDMAPAIIRKFEALEAGRTAGWTCAIGLAAFVRAIVEDTGEMLPCSLVLDGEYGQQDMCMTVPAHIGSSGVQKILEWELEADEKARLNQSIESLKAEMKTVEEHLQ